MSNSIEIAVASHVEKLNVSCGKDVERVYKTFNANLSGTATNLLKLTAPLYCPTVAISRTEVILHLREKNCIIDFSVALK